jgi:membrane fusion protein (multidrug efflux system)
MSIRFFVFILFFSPLAMAQQPPPARVVTVTVKSETLSPTSQMMGVLRFIQVSEVAADVEGLISEHHFDTGWVLKKGTVMAELNAEFIQKDIAIIRSQILEVDAELEKLAREVKRLSSLKQGQLASRSAYDEAFFSHKSSLARKKTLHGQLSRLQLSLEKSKVRAPFDGIVLEKLKEQGDWLGKGDAIARFASTNGTQAIIPISEKLLPFQPSGREFAVAIPALKRNFKGRLTGVVPFAELRSKSVYLKIALPYEAGMIENLSVEAQVPTAAPRQLQMIPRAALLQNPGADTVYTIVDGKAAPINLHIVSRSGDFIAVDSHDIKPNMAVIVDGNERLRPGQQVQLVEQ